VMGGFGFTEIAERS